MGSDACFSVFMPESESGMNDCIEMMCEEEFPEELRNEFDDASIRSIGRFA